VAKTNNAAGSIWGSTLIGWDVTVDHETAGTATRRIADRRDLDDTIAMHEHMGRTYSVKPIHKTSRG
jgi:hypothetical protein